MYRYLRLAVCTSSTAITAAASCFSEDEGGVDIYSKRNNMYMYYKYHVLSKNFITFIAGVPTPKKRLSEKKTSTLF